MFKKSFFNPSSAMMLALAKRCGVVYSKRHVNFGSVLSLELAGMGGASPTRGPRTASSRRRSRTHLLTVFGLGPSSEQHRTIGPPAEIMQSAVSRLNSPACLADGFDMASFLRSPSA